MNINISERKTLLIASLALFVSLSVAFSQTQPSSNSASVTDGFQNIKAEKTIRAAYVVAAPLFMIDPNTSEKSGIFHDVLVEAARRLSLSVDWNEQVGLGEMIQGLDAGRYDVVGSGIWINSDRARKADFTIPLYYDAVYAYVRTGDSLREINSTDVIISTMDGELGASIAEKDFPKAKTLQLPQNADFSQMILNVVERKADVVFLASGPAATYQKVNPGKITAIDENKPVRIFPNAIVIGKDQHELRRALDHAISEMLYDGTIDKILKKYEQTPNSFLRVSPQYVTQD
jgi:ABC-type amino acid transport substrate-binding protein